MQSIPLFTNINYNFLIPILQEGKSEYLEGLLEATKELSHIDRTNIFYHLLITYCKANETDKALGLWTLLQEEGEIPSEQFLAYLGNYLKSKNCKVPFAMPEVPFAGQNQIETKPKESKPKADTVRPPKSVKPTKNEVSQTIENLVKNERPSEAMEVAMKAIQQGVMPTSKVMKFMLKTLAEAGNVEKIQHLGNCINETMRRNVTYDDKLTLAIFNRGAGAQHIDSLLQSVNTAKTDEDLEIILKKFPRSNALASIMNNEDLLKKCKFHCT